MTGPRTTATAGVTIRPLNASDAVEFHTLIQENRSHLTQNGDYSDLVEKGLAGIREMLLHADVSGYLFGIFEHAELVGVVSLVPVDPPRYGCGYWLAEAATGRGLATEALRSLIVYALHVLAATDIYAGVTHGNEASIDVLTRTGFVPVEVFETYSRFHLALGTSER